MIKKYLLFYFGLIYFFNTCCCDEIIPFIQIQLSEELRMYNNSNQAAYYDLERNIFIMRFTDNDFQYNTRGEKIIQTKRIFEKFIEGLSGEIPDDIKQRIVMAYSGICLTKNDTACFDELTNTPLGGLRAFLGQENNNNV